MINTQHGNYVKFIRGTEASWAKIENSQKSSDTLYFISDTGSSVGKLYLGAKLISNGALTSATSMADLNDVVISAGITDQSILVYNNSTKEWEDKSLLEILQSILEEFKGATESEAGLAGLVPAPEVGQHLMFLRGDGSWADPTVGVSSIVEGLQQVITTLIGEDTELSVREIAQSEASAAVADIIAEAPEQFDTLKEIADWIQSNQGAVDVAGLTTRVTTLEEVIYGIPADEEAGTEEVLGLQTVVSTLQSDLNSLVSTVNTHTIDIAEIKDALRWQDIIEEEATE